jgi:hypothetical protein
MPLPRPTTIEVRADTVRLTREVGLPTEVALQALGWQDAITALVQPVRHALRADVVVGATHARLFVLPFASALNSEARWTAYASSRFTEIFGETTAGWWLRVVPERPGRPRLVAALPSKLMGTLESLLGRGLRSVRIDTLIRLDELRHREARFTGALIDAGPRHALVALMVDGTLQRLRLRRVVPSADELRSALTVEWAALGRDDALPALAVVGAPTLDIVNGEALRDLAPRFIQLH